MIQCLTLALFLYWGFCFIRWFLHHIEIWNNKQEQEAEKKGEHAIMAAKQAKKAQIEQEILASVEFQACLARLTEINNIFSCMSEHGKPIMEEAGKSFIRLHCILYDVPGYAVDMAQSADTASKDYQQIIDFCMLSIFGSQEKAAHAKELLGDAYFLENLHVYESCDKAHADTFEFVREFYCEKPSKFSKCDYSIDISTLYLRELEKKGYCVYYSHARS